MRFLPVVRFPHDETNLWLFALMQAIKPDRKLLKPEFIKNNRDVDPKLSPQLLSTVYERVTHNEIQMHGRITPATRAQTALYSAPILEGWLHKQPPRKGGGWLPHSPHWARRWFTLKGRELTYLSTPPAMGTPPQVRGSVPLEFGVHVQADQKDGSILHVINKGSDPSQWEALDAKSYSAYPQIRCLKLNEKSSTLEPLLRDHFTLRAADEDERDMWVGQLNTVLIEVEEESLVESPHFSPLHKSRKKLSPPKRAGASAIHGAEQPPQQPPAQASALTVDPGFKAEILDAIQAIAVRVDQLQLAPAGPISAPAPQTAGAAEQKGERASLFAEQLARLEAGLASLTKTVAESSAAVAAAAAVTAGESARAAFLPEVAPTSALAPEPSPQDVASSMLDGMVDGAFQRALLMSPGRASTDDAVLATELKAHRTATEQTLQEQRQVLEAEMKSGRDGLQQALAQQRELLARLEARMEEAVAAAAAAPVPIHRGPTEADLAALAELRAERDAAQRAAAALAMALPALQQRAATLAADIASVAGGGGGSGIIAAVAAAPPVGAAACVTPADASVVAAAAAAAQEAERERAAVAQEEAAAAAAQKEAALRRDMAARAEAENAGAEAQAEAEAEAQRVATEHAAATQRVQAAERAATEAKEMTAAEEAEAAAAEEQRKAADAQARAVRVKAEAVEAQVSPLLTRRARTA
jgi:hypothetical protein